MAVQLVLPPRTIALVTGVVMLLLAGGLGYIYLPKAKIVVTPRINTRVVEQDILLSTKATEPDFIRFVLPARLVETEVKAGRQFNRSQENLAEDFAKGQVTFRNEQEEAQELLPKSHLRHEATGVFFLTDKAVSIPGKGEIKVGVTAKEKGAKGEVAPGKFIVDKLPSSLQSVVYAESSQKFTGGLASGSALTEEEINKAKEELLQEAKGEAAGQLTAQAGGANISPDLTSMEVQSANVSAAPGSRAAQYEVALTLKAKGMAVDSNDLLSLTLLALRSKQSNDEEFISYEPESFNYTIKRADFERGEVLVGSKLSGTFGSKIGASSLSSNNIAGLSAAETKERFEQLPNIESVEVTFSPFWVKSAPSRPQSIEIVVENRN